MPGAMIGIIGKQRSGKTLIAYKLAKKLHLQAKEKGEHLPIYTNLFVRDDDAFTYVNSIDELPLDLSPKIVLIDEIYYGCDAQDYRKLKDISIFINTIGKQNCLFIWTSIGVEMVYNRIRNQSNLVILVKANADHIFYKLVFTDSMRQTDFIVEKTPQFFEDVHYDTQFIPLEFDWSMQGFKEKLSAFYRENFGLVANFD